MTKKTLTEEELVGAQCNDFSIQALPNDKDFLILMCKDQETSSKLMEILRNNAFDLKIFIDEKTGSYSLQFEFIDDDLVFRYNTGKSEEDYPPLEKLKRSEIKHITTGIWTGRSSKGRKCIYDPRFMRLGLFDIDGSFQQANEVQFIAGRSDKEPSLVLLIYDDYAHIRNAEADEAYNRLMGMAKMRPLLEIKPEDAETVNLRIWDILIDLDIQFKGLKFSETQLSEFLIKTDAKNSFAFALGFPAREDGKTVLASTKSGGFEFITLMGYTYKK